MTKEKIINKVKNSDGPCLIYFLQKNPICEDKTYNEMFQEEYNSLLKYYI